MIIVKTKNGDRFINDKAFRTVEHYKEKAVVNAYGDEGVFFHTEDVEEIIYNNDAQPINWKDEGSEIERLKKTNSELCEWGGRMRDGYLKMEQERDELKERLAQLEPKPVSEYANDRLIDKVYHEMDRLDVLEREENRLKHPNWGVIQKRGNAVRFMNVAKEHDIETVGQLLEVGRARFEQFRNMGRLCADRISEALDNLYGIKSW
jgi:molecular chaperone GrpE (heat shock protein)